MPPKKQVSITKKTDTQTVTSIIDDTVPESIVEPTVTFPTQQPVIVKKPIIQRKVKPETVVETVAEAKKPVANKQLKLDDDDEILTDVAKLPIDKHSTTSHVASHSKAKKTSKKTDPSSQQPDLFDDDNVDYRYIMMNYDFTKNKTRPIITKYEKALLVGKRAKQIESGARANVKVLAGQNAIEIAEEELRQRKIPLMIKRPIGNTFEYWKPVDMEVDMD
jgi:DNA-directed RNA polymerase subunit K/omega